MTRRSLLWWLRSGRRRQQQTRHDATVTRPQAIRMHPGWTPLPRVDPRPWSMSAQSQGKILPFPLTKPEYVSPLSDKQWDDSLAARFVEWAKADAGGYSDSGDENREQA